MNASLVLLPTFNESENLPGMISGLSRLSQSDVLVIDDSSPDGTGELAEELAHSYPRLSVLHRTHREGLGRAYVHGFRTALRRGYSRVLTMDADMSHDPADVPRLLGALAHADVAIGSRHSPLGGSVVNWPWSRRVLSRAGSLYARTLLGLPVWDVTSGFRAYRAEALSAVDLAQVAASGFVFQVEILNAIYRTRGPRFAEVPIVFRNRTRGGSKLSRRIVYEAAVRVLLLSLTGLKRKRGASSPVSPAFGFRERACGALTRRTENGPTAGTPKISVVIAVPPGEYAPRALGALEKLILPPDGVEVLISRGTTPSLQRNAAVARATGDYVLFLDDDSCPSGDLLDTYFAILESDREVAAVGGPAVPAPCGLFEKASASVLGEPLVMGRSASRYRARGMVRPSDERELILCNMAVRRQAFDAVGGFDEELYPNEENEFLERLKARGCRVVYHPRAQVTRPQWRSPPELLQKVFTYGRGRSTQAQRRLSVLSAARIGLSCGVLFGVIAGLVLWLLEGHTAFAVLPGMYMGYMVLLSIKLLLRGGLVCAVLGPVVAAMVHLGYACGVVTGLFLPLHRAAHEIYVEKRAVQKGVSV